MFTRQQAMLLPSLALFSVVAFAQQTEIRGADHGQHDSGPDCGCIVDGQGNQPGNKDK